MPDATMRRRIGDGKIRSSLEGFIPDAPFPSRICIITHASDKFIPFIDLTDARGVFMKKDCERTRRAFPRYLRGHVFRIERTRIERHLAGCVICRSEFEGLRRADETRRILKDIHISEGIVQQVKDGVATLSGLKKVFYRPLWLAAIALASAGVYYYIVTPRQLDLEIEKIERTAPATTAALNTEHLTTSTSMAAKPPVDVKVPEVSSAPAAAPLVVNIIPDNESAAVRQINEVLKGHEQLRGKRFSETVRVVSGSLTAGELEIFFDRIEPVARVSVNRKRLASIASTQPIPFTLKLLAAPKTVEKQPPSPTPVQMSVPAQAPTRTAIPAATETSPTTSTAE